MGVPDTLVTFPAGTVRGHARVLSVRALPDGRRGVVVDRTPFHPVDPVWPDQPADRWTLDGAEVIDCLVGTLDAADALALGDDVPARRGELGWSWVVLHVLGPRADAPAVGAQVELSVDPERRRALSAVHTATHVAALALNASTERFWRKEVVRDSLGHPDLDKLAIVSSVMSEQGCLDVYRFGRSLRRKGFEGGEFAAEAAAVQAAVEELVAEWVASAAPVRVEVPGDERLASLRLWVCELPEWTAQMPCGGTHVSSLADLDGVSILYEVADGGETLRATMRPGAVA
jgi:alanyl-tRNA synthetase